MENKSGIVSISLPFASGVCAAALLQQPFACALASSVAAASLIYMCAASGRRCTTRIMLLYFLLGAFCWSSQAIFPSTREVYSSAAIDAFSNLLDSIPFGGKHGTAIIKALLTGRRNALPGETVAIFRKSGASHILALSGLHLGIIYACIARLLRPLGNSPAVRLLRSAVTVTLCGLYAAATGASPSIMRAFLFIVINETGRALSGRSHSPLGTYCIALTMHLAINPAAISSAGFQLSYLAMLGITIIYPQLRNWYPGAGRADPVRYIWNGAALSLSCQVFTAPAAWWHFHSFPLYFMITNLIALPLTELVIISALAAALLQATTGCPPALAGATGKLVDILEFCLETIASI